MNTLLASAWISNLKYPLLIVAALFEGPIIMTVSGFLVRIGLLQFLPAYVALMAGDLLGDNLWYAVGAWYGYDTLIKHARFFGITNESLAAIQKGLKKHYKKIILISKLTMGFGFAIPILITAGIIRLPYKNFLLLNVLGEFVWTALLLMVGYFFGNVYLTINKDLRDLTLAAFLIIVAAALYGFRNYLKTKNIYQEL